MLEIFISDVHLPFQDKAGWGLTLEVIKQLKPDLVFLGGDILDCVTPDTKILTSTGKWIPAGEVVIGQNLIGFDEFGVGATSMGRNQPRKLRNSTITNLGRALQPVYKLYMDDGTELKSSAGHKWLGWGGNKSRGVLKWFTTQEIAERINSNKHQPVLLCKPCDVWEQSHDYESGYIAAAFDGEGHITFNKQQNNFGHIAFSQKSNAFMDNVSNYLLNKGFSIYTTQNEHRTVQQLNIKGGFWDYLKFLGMFNIPRFTEKWVSDAPIDGYRGLDKQRASVMKVEYLGVEEIVMIETSSKTYIAEGFASHNCYAVSKYDRDPSRKLTLQQDLNYAHEELAKIRKAVPKAEIVLLEGNHEQRLTKYLHSKAEELSCLEALELKSLLKLDSLKIKWIPNGTRTKIGKLWHLHGNEIAGGGTNIAKSKFDRLGTNVIFGHHHKLQSYTKRNYEGEVCGAWANPCMSDLQPDYAHFTDWVLGFSIIEYGKNGIFNVEQIPVIKQTINSSKASCFVRGTEYEFESGEDTNKNAPYSEKHSVIYRGLIESEDK